MNILTLTESQKTWEAIDAEKELLQEDLKTMYAMN